jgi:wyosine [tRNA(Phe)-imidazoG37] synthetase (radical SAM superfamily)
MLTLQEGVVYGPVRSRRLGHSLGINILPRNTKVCTFNCTYCQYGWTKTPVRDASSVVEPWPSPSSIARAVSARARRLLDGRDPINRLTLAGNGEPTLHPQFVEVVDQLRAARDEAAPGLPIAILSNASTLDLPGVVKALNRLDERYMKLDAGDAGVLRRVNAAQVPLERIVEGLSRLRDVVVQTMFVRDRLGRIDNATDMAVASWIGTLVSVKPREVHVYSIDRAPAWPYLQAIPAARLEEIARRVRAAGLNAVAFGGPASAEAASRQAGGR